MRIASNIWKLQADRFLVSCWFFASILVPFYEANGLTATQVFTIQSVFAAVLALCEIPTGYFADTFGRRRALILGALMIPCGIAIYSFSHSFSGFIIAEIFLAVGLSLRSGAETAILYDTLLETTREKEHKRIEGKAFFFQQIGSTLANVAGGLISTISLRLPFVVNIFTSLLLLPLALSLKEPEKEHKETQKLRAHASDILKVLKYCGTHPHIRNASLYLTLINGICLVGYWSYYLYYSKLDIPIGYFGFLAAAHSLLAGIGGKAAHYLEAKWGEQISMLLPLLIIPSYIIIGWSSSFWAVPLILLNAFLWGFSIPLLKDILHKHTRSQIRATVLSVASMGGRIAFIGISSLMGVVTDTFSVQTGFIMLGTLFLLGSIVPVWKLSRA